MACGGLRALGFSIPACVEEDVMVVWIQRHSVFPCVQVVVWPCRSLPQHAQTVETNFIVQVLVAAKHFFLSISLRSVES